MASTLVIRGFRVRIVPYQDRSWVTITHLPYGLVEKDIRSALSIYGKVADVTFVEYRKVRTGTVKVRMDISLSIPTRIRVCGHAGLVYHQGQVRTCYNCGEPGHESRRCPKKATVAKPTTSAVPSVAAPASLQTKRKRKRSKGKKKATVGVDPVVPPMDAVTASSGSDDLPAKKGSFDAIQLAGEYEEPDVADAGGPVADPTGEVPPSVPMTDVEPTPRTVTPFIVCSVLAAKSAPPDPVNDAAYPRQVDAPCFRAGLGAPGYEYSEEGELDASYSAELRRKLKMRGDEIRAIMRDYDKQDPSYGILDDTIVVVLSEEERVEVPVKIRRSTLANLAIG